ncbi:AAA-type ATPase [Klebsormidium nitens]|uniref:AAA-type ATPase n=1 Tax=Klebsormidium nitens TaxID=105231 RepID=A0A1Y1HRW5_KLENI|nr:AAA-type ATPase [Klebsormidium nitens]|eukprot:GAQ79721.1 AAA-type ATPase [Klebsormidium nitens]
MVATRRSGSAGKSPSDTNEESTGGQEEPRKLRGRRLSAGNADSGKRSASPAELPEVTSAKRQKIDEGEQAEKAADNTEALEPEKGAEPVDAVPAVEGAKPTSPLREVKDEVVEDAPGAQVKEEEEAPQGLPPAESPRPPNQHLAGSPAAQLGNYGEFQLRMRLMRAKQQAEAEAMRTPLMAPSSSLAEQKWGDLISQFPENPHAVLSGVCFTIGRSKSCSLRLPDAEVSGMLARIFLKGNLVYFENLGGTGTVSLNGRDAKRGDKAVLKSGDELTFSGSKQFAYIFQQRTDTPLPLRQGGAFPSVDFDDNMERVMLKIPRPSPTPVSDLMIETLSRLPNARSPREGPNPKPPLPTRAFATSLRDAAIAEMRTLQAEKEALERYVSQWQASKDSVVSNPESSQGREKEGETAEAEKAGGHTPKEAAGKEGVYALNRARSFEALLQAAGEASKGREAVGEEKDGNEGGGEAEKAAPESEMKADLGTGGVVEAGQTDGEGTRIEPQVSKEPQAGEAKGLREAPSLPNPGKDEPVDLDAKTKAAEGAVAAKRAALKESFAKALVDPSGATVSFANFPYYLSETTKQLLIGSAFVHLKKNEYVKYTKELAALSPRMLLAGGSGTDIYQETLVRALAAHFGAKLMVMDAAGTDEEPSPTEEAEEVVEPAVEAVPEEERKVDAMSTEEPTVPETGNHADAGDPPKKAPAATDEGGDMVVDEEKPTEATPSEPPAPVVLEREGTPTETRPIEQRVSEAAKAKALAETDITQETDNPTRPAETPEANSLEPMETEAQPSSSENGTDNAAEVPDLNLAPTSGKAALERKEGELEPGETKVEPGGKEILLEDSVAVTREPGERDPPGSGEKDDDSVHALLEGDNEDEKEEDFWGRSDAKMDRIERSLSVLLATSRPEGGRGEQGARGKEGKKGQFFKRGDRVRFRGGPGTANVSSSLHTYLCGLAAEKQLKTDPPIRGPCVGCRGTVKLVYSPSHKLGISFDKAVPGGSNLGNQCDDGHGFWCNAANLELLETVEGVDTEGMRMDALFEVLSEASAAGPVILYIPDAERSIMGNLDKYLALRKKLEGLQGPIVAIASYIIPDAGKEKFHVGGSTLHKFGGQQTSLLELSFINTLSRLEERGKEQPKIAKVLEKLFPSKIKIQPPQKDSELHEWKKQIEKDVATLKAESNRGVIQKVLRESNVGCEQLAALEVKDQILSPDQAQKVVAWAASHYLMAAEEPAVKKGRLQLTVDSLRSGVELLRSLREDGSPLKKSLKDIVLEDDFEKRLLSEVIPAEEIGVGFDDIGALESVKETLRELVMLPLQRPELFSRGQLTKPTKGILLFGPPGTGKTMLAKAVATEAGANFINISVATIASKWFGEGEKYVKAVFTLASKLAPSIVFIDEVDSMLGRREKPGEHEAMRKIKNEFMANWDGLRTKDRERVLVLAATNRPFDLDEAVVRRMPRRLMVPLPDAENRRKILHVILGKEELSAAFDFEELSQMTDGYSGSDLKNLCVTAAYQPIREILENEKKERAKAKTEGRPWVAPSSDAPPPIRPLNMNDMRLAKEQVSASVSPDAASSTELEQWNDQYGEGGSRQKTQLTYFM